MCRDCISVIGTIAIASGLGIKIIIYTPHRLDAQFHLYHENFITVLNNNKYRNIHNYYYY